MQANEVLEDVRTLLRRKQAHYYDKIEDDQEEIENEELANMQLLTDAGQHKAAAELLRILPRSENETVQDYKALVRVHNRVDFDHPPENALAHANELEREIRNQLMQLRDEARGVVKERLERTHTKTEDRDATEVTIKDPVSKMQVVVEATYPDLLEQQSEQRKEQLIEDVIHRGVGRPQ